MFSITAFVIAVYLFTYATSYLVSGDQEVAFSRWPYCLAQYVTHSRYFVNVGGKNEKLDIVVEGSWFCPRAYGKNSHRAQNTLLLIPMKIVGILRHLRSFFPLKMAPQIITQNNFHIIKPCAGSIPHLSSHFPLCSGAVDEEGRMPFYAEECASMLAVTFSGGDKMLRSIVSASQIPYPLPFPQDSSLAS